MGWTDFPFYFPLFFFLQVIIDGWINNNEHFISWSANDFIEYRLHVEN